MMALLALQHASEILHGARCALELVSATVDCLKLVLVLEEYQLQADKTPVVIRGYDCDESGFWEDVFGRMILRTSTKLVIEEPYADDCRSSMGFLRFLFQHATNLETLIIISKLPLSFKVRTRMQE